MSILTRLFGDRRPPTPGDPAELAHRLGVPSPDQPRSLALYAYDTCPYCRRVYQALQGLGIEVPVRNTRADPLAAQELRALTGGSQVPCLVIDGQPLLESADIIAWLESYKANGSSR